MTPTIVERLGAAEVAGGGLLSRRRLLGGSLVFGGTAAANCLGIIEEVFPSIDRTLKTTRQPSHFRNPALDG